MCRSIKTLRRVDRRASDQEIQEAALQFVRKVSGFRQPSQANRQAFTTAVDEISTASRRLLTALPNRQPAPARMDDQDHPPGRSPRS